MPPDSLLMALVVETHGGWHAEGLTLVREVVKLAAKRANRPWAEDFRRFMGKMSVVLQRQNAVMILGRGKAYCPTGTHLPLMGPQAGVQTPLGDKLSPISLFLCFYC